MTSMNSDRFQVQQLIEFELGCSDPDQLKQFKSQFESLTVSSELHPRLVSASFDDARGLYFKALLSISEAVLALSRSYHSWAVVKLYYSVFFLTRCVFAARSLAIVKCSGIYTLETTIGASPIKRDKGKFKGQDIKGDHKTVLATYVNDLGKNDKIISNKVGTDTVFEWMMKKREEVHYRAPTFLEPDFQNFEISIHREGKLAFWVDQYLSDVEFIYCFQENHCCLATALQFAQQAKLELTDSFPSHDLLSESQVHVIETILRDTGVWEVPKFRNLGQI